MSSHAQRRTLPPAIRTLLATLAAIALIAPVVQAQAAHQRAPAAPTAANSQDHRSPDARDAALAHAAADSQDLRSPDARDATLTHAVANPHTGGAYMPGTTPVQAATPRPPAAPQWPKNPQPIAHARTVNTSTSEGSINWILIGVGIVGGLLTFTGLAAVARRNRRARRTRVIA